MQHNPFVACRFRSNQQRNYMYILIRLLCLSHPLAGVREVIQELAREWKKRVQGVCWIKFKTNTPIGEFSLGLGLYACSSICLIWAWRFTRRR